jgi:antitoxin component YwqK of YwqJK toxin-antitoxin module
MVAFIILTVSCSVEKETSNLKEIDGFKYEIDSEIKFTGKYITYWEKGGLNGHKKEEYHYKNGKKNGLMTTWHENGNKHEEANLKDDEMYGLITQWYENGNKKSEIHLKDNKINGLMLSWHKNGNKKIEGNHKDGELDGLVTAWYEDGSKKHEIYYKDGKITKSKEFPIKNISRIIGMYKCKGIGTMISIELKPNGRFSNKVFIIGGDKHGQEGEYSGIYKLYDSQLVLDVTKSYDSKAALVIGDSPSFRVNGNTLSAFGGKCVKKEACLS